jgi:hypothetical protein
VNCLVPVSPALVGAIVMIILMKEKHLLVKDFEGAC